MSYLRNKTRPQGDRPIRTRQINYGGGLNVDIPATDINNNQCIGIENYIAFERYLEGRSGSVEVDDMPGSGTLHGRPVYHPIENVLLFHRGSKLYRWDGSFPSAVEILDYDTNPFGIDKDSTIKIFNNDALMFTEDGIFFLLVRNGLAKFFPMDIMPETIEGSGFPSTTEPYKHKYAYTFSLIVTDVSGSLATSGDRLTAGQTLIWESPPVLSDVSPNDFSYFRLRSSSAAVDSGNSISIILGTNDALRFPIASVSHMSVYRTRDLGQNGIDNINDEQFGWVGDEWIDPALPAATTLVDTLTDGELEPRLRDPLLSLTTIGWSPLTVGSIGEVTNSFVFTANDNGKNLYYSQRVDDNNVAFHNAGFQTKEFNDGIRILAGTPDILTIMCNRSTHITTLTAFSDRGGIFESVAVLDHFDRVDSQLGIQDVGSFSEVSRGTYIAICSDKSVRIWDGSGWSRDLAHDTVSDIINRSIEGRTTSVYFSNGTYFLWMDTGDSGYPDTCLRLALKRESGKGWTEYTGASWVFPPAKWGAFISDNFLAAEQLNIDLMMVWDRSDDKIYWVETYDGPEGKTLNGFEIREYYADKVSASSPNGTPIKCRHKVKEITGTQESFNIIHQQSHAYMRDLADTEKYSPVSPISYGTLKIDARAYVNGLLVDAEAAGQVDPGDDIEFWYRVEGDRISIEFESNRSAHQIQGTDSRFRVQDIMRPTRGAAENIATSFQDEFQTALRLWAFTRPLVFLERVANTRLSANGQTTLLGPDARSDGFLLAATEGGDSPYIKVDTTIFDEFTFNVWIKTPTLVGGAKAIILKLNGANTLTITLDDSNILETVEFGGMLAIEDPDTAANNVNGWSQLIFVRDSKSTTFNVYQNDELKGTLPISGSNLGGTSVEMGGVV